MTLERAALDASSDDLDAVRRHRATRMIADVLTVVIGGLMVVSPLMQPSLSTGQSVLGWAGVLLFAGCAALARTRHWRVASVLIIASSAPLVSIDALLERQFLSASYFLGPNLLLAAAMLSTRGVLVSIAGALGAAAFLAAHTAGGGAETVAHERLVVLATVMILNTGLGALLLASTLRKTLSEAQARTQRALAAEARVREEEARYRLFADHTDDLITLLDASGKCVYASPSHQRVLGVDPTTFMVNSEREGIVHSEDLEDTMRAFVTALTTGSAATRTRLRTTSGKILWFDIVMNAVDHLGGRYVATTARDVTKQRQLADQLQQAQKMDALGRLAGGVAHDFNNLLTIIQTCANLATRAPDTPPRTLTLLDDIEKAASRAGTLTRQLLRFSRREVVAPKAMDLRAALADAIALGERLVGPSVQLVATIPEELWSVAATPTQLEQVLLNLAANARDAMPEGGTLRVVASNVPGSEPAEGKPAGPRPGKRRDHVEILVADTGVGMSPETLAHAFEPFFTTKAAGLGTGLGLASCYGIIEQLGGTITVESSPLHGTTFTIRLPRAEHSAAEPAPPSISGTVAVAERAPPHKRTVLLVEDEAPLLARMAEVVQGEGHTVLTATSLEEARWQAASRGVDILVTDIVLGEDSGLDVMRLVRASSPDAGVILTSGYVQDANDVARHVAMKAEFLPKPFTAEALAVAVRRAVDRLARPADPPSAGALPPLQRG